MEKTTMMALFTGPASTFLSTAFILVGHASFHVHEHIYTNTPVAPPVTLNEKPSSCALMLTTN